MQEQSEEAKVVFHLLYHAVLLVIEMLVVLPLSAMPLKTGNSGKAHTNLIHLLSACQGTE